MRELKTIGAEQMRRMGKDETGRGIGEVCLPVVIPTATGREPRPRWRKPTAQVEWLAVSPSSLRARGLGPDPSRPSAHRNLPAASSDAFGTVVRAQRA